MLGILSWIGCGAIIGFFMTRMMQGRDLGLVLFTIGVAIVGSLIGGFGASFFGAGNVATFSLYGVLLAIFGAVVALLAYRRILAV
jgi:uncharacterized membrane protein YeaQ/YmgE (transglycosylase-associated protein family)